MSDASPSTFHKVISDRHFFRWSLISATASSLFSALLLVVGVICCGGVTALLVSGTQSRGILLWGQGLSQIWGGRFLAELINATSTLHQSASALVVLFAIGCIVVMARVFLQDYARQRIRLHAAAAVNRLREHIHRHAMRSNPADLTGVQRQIAGRLFRQTAQRLEDSAAQWGFCRITAIFDLGALLVTVICVNWRVGIECIVPVVVCWYISRQETARHAASTDLLAEQVDRGIQKLTDDLDRARMVSGYGMEGPEHDYFSQSLQQYRQRCEQLQRQQVQGGWVLTAIRVVMVALPGFIISRHIISGSSVDVASAVMLIVTIGLLTFSLFVAQQIPSAAGAATVAAEEIQQFLLRVPAVSQLVGARFMEPMSRLLQFSQVRVETETHPELLSGLDLRIEFGQRVALLSLNSSEIHAVISLIPRFIDPAAGQVLIDGQDVRRATFESLRAEALIVGSGELVFNATVMENITANRSDISRQDAIEASKSVHAESFIRRLPKSYETLLGDQGLRLEAGQSFRLSLARAIARKPALLVIQEPEAALDTETKTMLDDAYQRICTGRTVIFLPSRLSTVKKCDRIVMLHQGKVAADGSHEELVRSSELYRHWEYMRFNVFR